MSEKAKELSSPVQDAWANTPSPPRNSNRATPISPPIATPSLARDSNRVTPISPPRSAGHFDAEEAEVDENIVPDQEGIEILAQQSSENTSSSRSLQYVQSSPRDSALDPSLDDDEVGTGTSGDHRDPLPTSSKDTTSTEHHLQTPQLLPAPQTSPVKRMSPLSEQKHEVEVQVEDAQPPVLIEDVCSASSSSSKAESAESYVINNATGGLGRMGPPASAQETRETFSTTTPLHPVRSPVFTPPPKKRVAPGGSSSLDESPSAGSPTLLIAPQPIASPTRRPMFRPISMPAPPQPPTSTSALSSMALSQGSFYKADDLDLESDVSGGISTVRSVVEGVEDGDCPPAQGRNIGVVSPPPPTTLATPTLTAEEASEGSEMIASSPDVSPKLSNTNTATTTRPTKKKATSEPPRAGANSVLADGSLENFKMVRGALVRRDLLVQEKDSSGVKQGGVTIEVVTGEAGTVEYIHCPAAQNVAEQRAAGADATVVAAVNSGVSLRGLESGASVDFSAGMTAGAGGRVDRNEKETWEWDEEQQALEGENHAKSHQSQRPSVTFELQSLGRVVAPGEEGADTPVASAGKKLFAKSPAVKAAGGPLSFLPARQTAPALLFPKRSPMLGANVAPVKMKKVRNSTGGENGNVPTSSVDNGAKGNIKSAEVVATGSAASRTSHRYYTSGASISSAVSAASSRAKMIAQRQSASPITPRVPWTSVSSTLNSSSPSAEDTPRPLDTQNDGGTSLHRMKAYDQNRRKSSGSNISVVLVVSAANSTSVRGPGAGSHQKARALPAPSVANRAPGQGSTKRGPPSNGKGSTRAGYHDEVAPPSLLLLPSPEPSGVGQQQSPRALQRGPGGILPGGTPTGIAEETANTSSGKHESKYQHLRKRVQEQQNLDHVVKKTSSENSAVSRTSSVASSASALSPVSSGPRKLSGLAQAENPTSFFPGSSDENGFSLLVLNGREWRWLCLLLVFVYTALFYGVEPAKTKPVPFTAESKNASAAANSDSKVLHSHEEVKEELVPQGEQRQIISSAASSSSGEDEQEFGTHLSTSTTSTSSTTKTLSTSSTTSARARPRAAKTSQKELWKNATIRRSLTQSTKKTSKKRTSTSAMWMGSAGTGRKERPGVEVLEQVSAREDEVADENSKVEKPTTRGHVRDEDEDDAAQSRTSTLDRDHEEVSPTASSWTSWSLGLGASAVSVLGIFGAAFTRGGDNTLL